MQIYYFSDEFLLVSIVGAGCGASPGRLPGGHWSSPCLPNYSRGLE